MMTGKQMFVRSVLTAALPFVLAWAFAAELWRGLRSAVRYASLEVRANLASYRELMDREDL
ncbi:hypothetical protein [Bradyrhizobium cytisi]|uniref:Uncharacterized protein n=1 Tax=Bradyrhizobium cytisi TaxID=515489 RepID=A0A5S4VVR6_9BRAD|nr:hypothetical protein [Bradyrhizobium cytisi]TYL72057.1 hypothetical protein FXB38_39205 [Bradyrhizobium cytisi]